MPKTAKEYRDVFMDAIDAYMNMNFQSTDFETSFSWNNERGCFGVFDLPADYVPFASGGIDDSPEYRMKPVLIARIQPDGSVTVDETEFTDRYMKRTAKVSANAYEKVDQVGLLRS